MAAKKKRKKRPTGLIQTYGVYWKKSNVPWSVRKHRGLWGNRTRTQKRHPDVNFWKQAGVYILYNALFEPIYSGQAKQIGSRLHAHKNDRWRGPKWDYFSWYGLKKLKKGDKGLCRLNERYGASVDVTLDTLEAVLIVVGMRTENKQGPMLHGAVAFHQMRPYRVTLSRDGKQRKVSVFADARSDAKRIARHEHRGWKAVAVEPMCGRETETAPSGPSHPVAVETKLRGRDEMMWDSA